MTAAVVDTIKRAINTFAQSLIAVLGVSSALEEVQWLAGLSVAALASLISLLQSVIRYTRTDDE